MFETFEFITEEYPCFFASLVAIFGAVTGSFLNVCIYRIPVGRSIIFPGSSCACGRGPIPFYHNIPIFTWIILRGRASCCEETFSIRYPAIELPNAISLWVWTITRPLWQSLECYLWLS